jgi:superoxide reductase
MEQAQQPLDPKNLNDLEQKHWPQIEPIHPKENVKFAIKVKVGVVPHVMTEEHQIVFIEAFYGSKPVGKKFLKPGDLPEATFEVVGQAGQVFKANEFCNLHGLWQNEKVVL